MKRLLIILLLTTFIIQCSEPDNQKEKISKKYFGTYITNDIRKGRVYYDASTRTSYFYCYVSTKITNDSLIPMQLKIAFSKNDFQPTPANGQKFKVFLQPKILADEELKKCLDGNNPSFTLNKIINPKEEYILNIGFLTELKTTLNPLPFQLFSKEHRQHFGSIPDSAINQVSSERNQLTLLLGLDFYPLGSDSIKRYSVIPCGQISFSN